MSFLRRRRRGRPRPVNGPRNACSVFGVLCVLGAVMSLVLLTAVAYGVPALTKQSGQNMTDHFDGSTVIGKFVLNGIWIIFLMLGILVGVLHGWWKEEGILQAGLEEWREWRQR